MMDMMNMGGGASASMNGSMGTSMGNMGNMPGMTPSSMNGMMDPYSMGGMSNYMADPNAMVGHVGAGSAGLFGGSLFGSIFNLAVELLAILLVIGLVVGIVILFKKYLFDGELFAVKAKTACTNCGNSLDTNWACCPKCGTAKKARTQPVNVNPQTV